MRTEGWGRNRALIIAVTIFVVALALGGVSIALDRTSRSGEEASGHTSRVDRKDPPAGTTPAPRPSRTARSSKDLERITRALGGAGYACYEAVTKPVVVDSCYLEPGTKSYEDQTVYITTADDGSVAAVEIYLSYFDSTAAPLKLFRKTLDALDGALLPAKDVRAVMEGSAKDGAPATPGTQNSLHLEWGTGTVTVNEDKKIYHLDLVAHGAKPRVIPAGDTEAGIVDIRDNYTGQGFRCTVDKKLKSLKCQRHVAGAVYTIVAVDPCLGAAKKYDLICKGRKATSVEASIGFAANLPTERFKDFGLFLLKGMDYAMGGTTTDAGSWLGRSIGDGAAHSADFKGMHVAFKPGEGAHAGYPNAVSLVVRGLNFSL